MINDIPDRPLDPPEEPISNELDEDEAYDEERQYQIDQRILAEIRARVDAHESKLMRKHAQSIADDLINVIKGIGGG